MEQIFQNFANEEFDDENNGGENYINFDYSFIKDIKFVNFGNNKQQEKKNFNILVDEKKLKIEKEKNRKVSPYKIDKKPVENKGRHGTYHGYKEHVTNIRIKTR